MWGISLIFLVLVMFARGSMAQRSNERLIVVFIGVVKDGLEKMLQSKLPKRFDLSGLDNRRQALPQGIFFD